MNPATVLAGDRHSLPNADRQCHISDLPARLFGHVDEVTARWRARRLLRAIGVGTLCEKDPAASRVASGTCAQQRRLPNSVC